MASSRYEIVEVRRIDQELGRYGGVFRSVYQAERVGFPGRRVLTRSHEVEWRRSDLTYRSDDLHAKLRAAHDQVLDFLLARGWEPLGTDQTGRVATLRRKSDASITARLASRGLGSGWLLLNGHWIYRPGAGSPSSGQTRHTTGGLCTNPLGGAG